MRKNDCVVLVNQSGFDLFDLNGRPSVMEKIEAHRQGTLHRAVSVFIFNERNDFLLQRRALNKYHSPGKWTNTCCTHPLPGEATHFTAQRRLYEEMGIVIPLSEIFTFSYQADVGNDLIENEFDHVFFGLTNHNPTPNPSEVSDWVWVDKEKLGKELLLNPGKFSVWLRLCFRNVVMYKFNDSENDGTEKSVVERPRL